MTDALRGGWKVEYDPWRPRFDPFFAECDSTEVFVLLWGPGKHTKYYVKRESIVAHLGARPANRVATSEQLIERDARFKKYRTLEAEEIQAAEADVIICLLVDDPNATGAPAELTRFEDNPAIDPKIRCLLPKKPRKGLLHEAGQHIDSERSFRYSQIQFQQCDDIRAKCHEWVEAVRRRKHFKRWKEAKSKS